MGFAVLTYKDTGSNESHCFFCFFLEQTQILEPNHFTHKWDSGLAVLTLNDGQEDDDDEEEERDVKDDAVELRFVSGRVIDLIADPPAGTHAHVHVKHVTLKTHTPNH